MFNFMTAVRSLQYAVLVEAGDGGETHPPRLNQLDRYEIRRGCGSSLRGQKKKVSPTSNPGRRQGSVWSAPIQVDGVGGPATGDLGVTRVCQGPRSPLIAPRHGPN